MTHGCADLRRAGACARARRNCDTARGAVSAANSLVGSKFYDQVVNRDIIVLDNDNYVVSLSNWDNDAVVDAGAATWCSGLTSAGAHYATEVAALTATPAISRNFAGWGGACSGTGACTVAMTQSQTVTATFTLKSHDVTVPATVPGGKIDVSAVGAIDTSDAVAMPAGLLPSFAYGTLLTFTTTPDPGFTFGNWTGDLTGNVNPQQKTLTGPLNVGAICIKGIAPPVDAFPINAYLPTIAHSHSRTGVAGVWSNLLRHRLLPHRPDGEPHWRDQYTHRRPFR